MTANGTSALRARWCRGSVLAPAVYLRSLPCGPLAAAHKDRQSLRVAASREQRRGTLRVIAFLPSSGDQYAIPRPIACAAAFANTLCPSALGCTPSRLMYCPNGLFENSTFHRLNDGFDSPYTASRLKYA
jgi:hypothetical protein